MRLENRKQQVVPLRHFMRRMFRYFMVSIGLIIISLCIGVLGYHFSGKLGWLDSFHMACMILTGMGPVIEMKTAGAKIFSSFYALYSGVAFLSMTAVFFAPIVHRVLHILQVDTPDDSG